MNPTNQEKQLAVLKGQLGEGIVQRAPVEAGLNTNSRSDQRMTSTPSALPGHLGGGNDALPSDWAETTSPNRNTYYYGREGTVTWQRPDGTIPTGWFEAIAPSGWKYYFNRALGTSTSQRPAIPEVSAPVKGTEGLPAVAADDHSAKTPVSALDDAGDVRTTRASAIAGASCRVPVKPQRKAKKKASAQPAHLQNEPLIYGNGDDAFPVDPSIAATTAAFGAINMNDQQNGMRSPNETGSRSGNPFGLGANRTRNAWNPHEKSPQKTLEDYKVPELSRGSCVSYSEDAKVQRQVGKARNGEFKEEAVVWGV
ncbi:hypothetical protein KC352_g42523, partial [Hortaea werneckii]